MHTCEACSKHGLRFNRAYQPEEFIEGNRNARVWIVGLNPAADPGWIDSRTSNDLETYFDDQSKVHGYFRKFKIVSERIYGLLGKPNGVAHTDLIKCSSLSWPPKGLSGPNRAQVIANCATYLKRQIRELRPRLIVCNGGEVSAEIRRFLPPPHGTPVTVTSYVYAAEDVRVGVVLSGFIGRIDNYAKRRLGAEIERMLMEMGG